MRPGNRIKARAGLGRRVRVFQGEVELELAGAGMDVLRIQFPKDMDGGLGEIQVAADLSDPLTLHRGRPSRSTLAPSAIG